MTRCTALDAAKWGVRVNAVCPGPILTDGTKRHAQMLGVTLEEACREMTSRQIIPRSDPVQIASVHPVQHVRPQHSVFEQTRLCY